MIGAITGMAIGLWWGLGAFIAGKRPATLPLKVDGCLVQKENWTNILDYDTTPLITEITSGVSTFPTSDDPAMSQSSGEDR